MNIMRNLESKARSERGNIMVGALLILMVLTAMGMTYVAVTKTETQIAGYERRHVQSMFNAEAGVSEALARLSDSRDTTTYFGQNLAAVAPSPGWGRYMSLAGGNAAKDPDYAATQSDSLDNDGDGLIDESGERYPEVLSLQTGSNAVSYPWVKVRYRLTPAGKVVLYGDHDNNPGTQNVPNLTVGQPILIVSSEGSQGTSDRRIEVQAVKSPFDAPKAAIYTESDNFKFNGTQFLVSGRDWDPATGDTLAGSTQVPGIMTTANPGNITSQLNGQQTNNVEGTGAEPSVTSAPFDYDLQAMINQYAPLADDVHNGGTIANGSIPAWGGMDDYKIVHVTNDLHISGSVSGGGLLLLQGELTISGSFTWYGMVINVGTITFTGGGNDIHIYGSVLSTGGVSRNNIGGNADLLYSSKALAKLAAFNPYQIVAWTELP